MNRWEWGAKKQLFEKYAMKFIGIYYQMNCNPMWWLSLLLCCSISYWRCCCFPSSFWCHFFRHNFFRFASHRMKWNCIALKNVTMCVCASMRSVITLQIYLKQFCCVCQTKSTLDLCTISLSPSLSLCVALSHSMFLVHLLKRNLIFAEQLSKTNAKLWKSKAGVELHCLLSTKMHHV